jgi:hypothetical protein
LQKENENDRDMLGQPDYSAKVVADVYKIMLKAEMNHIFNCKLT